MLEKMTRDVARFHAEVTGQPMPGKPTQLSRERKEYATKHLVEELDEFEAAWVEGNLPKQADALVDLIYVAMGRLLEMGFAPGAAFDEVHRANMGKVAGRVAKRGNAPFDAAKPEDWTTPDVARWLSLTREDLDTLARAKASGYSAMTIPSMMRHEPRPQFATTEFSGRAAPTPTPRPAVPAAEATLKTNDAATLAKKRAKAPLSMVPVELIEPTARVFQFGAVKYSRDGYKDADYTHTELVDSLMRHAHEFLAGKDYDLDPATALPDEWKKGAMWSGLPIIGHMGCCVSMLAYRWRHRPGSDDRRYEYDGRFRADRRKA